LETKDISHPDNKSPVNKGDFGLFGKVKWPKVLAKVLADSGKCRDVFHCSPVSEIFQIRRRHQQLEVASNRAVETFGSLPRSLPRR
jgi:hypothetical protein